MAQRPWKSTVCWLIFWDLLSLFIYNQNYLLWVGVGLLLSVLGPPTSFVNQENAPQASDGGLP